jgi:hypothetical protein
VSASITDLWAYVTLRPSGSMGGTEALCFVNGRPLVASSRREAGDMLRLALLTPGPVRLRRFRFSEDSGLVPVPDHGADAQPEAARDLPAPA